MSANVTNRVYLPDGAKVYLSDDRAGDYRAEQLFEQYGDLKLEACYKDSNSKLDDLVPFWTGTLVENYGG